MNIYCIGIVKNEADVIRQSLLAASSWATTIFVADNGSDDGTLEIIKELSETCHNIVFFGVIDDPFYPSIRTQIFHQYSHVSRPGDWWCRFDADEFFIDDPSAFLLGLPSYIDSVWSQCYQFYFTDLDYAKFVDDPDGFLALDLFQRFRFYSNNWSELRFVKHTRYMYWPIDRDWPVAAVSPSSATIRLRTYQHRSPEQITYRLASRLEIALRTGFSFQHVLNSVQKQRFSSFKDSSQSSLSEADFRSVIKSSGSLLSLDLCGFVCDPAFHPSYPRYFRFPSVPIKVFIAFFIHSLRTVRRLLVTP